MKTEILILLSLLVPGFLLAGCASAPRNDDPRYVYKRVRAAEPIAHAIDCTRTIRAANEAEARRILAACHAQGVRMNVTRSHSSHSPAPATRRQSARPAPASHTGRIGRYDADIGPRHEGGIIGKAGEVLGEAALGYAVGSIHSKRMAKRDAVVYGRRTHDFYNEVERGAIVRHLGGRTPITVIEIETGGGPYYPYSGYSPYDPRGYPGYGHHDLRRRAWCDAIASRQKQNYFRFPPGERNGYLERVRRQKELCYWR